MDLDIRGLRVMVSAGASGIGLEIARVFAREGARVHVCDVDELALERLRSSDPSIGSTRCDVASREEVARFFDEAMAALHGLDCFVNNAGIAGPTGRIEEIDPAEWDRCIAVGLTGQFNCARLAVPHLRRSANASLMNVSSLAGRLGFAMRAPYAAAKWGVIGLIKSLAIEVAGDGVTVNAVAPTSVDTLMIQNEAFWELFLPEKDEILHEDVVEAYRALNPIPEPWLAPEDVSATAAFLALLGTAVLATATGWIASYRILGLRPLEVLREE